MKTIELKGSDELASQLEQLPPEKLRELEGVISDGLDPRKELLKVMRETQAYAKKQGLTEEKLNELLKEDQ